MLLVLMKKQGLNKMSEELQELVKEDLQQYKELQLRTFSWYVYVFYMPPLCVSIVYKRII